MITPNEKLPIVSIVIATYNSEAVLDKVLESIRKQDYPKYRIEILIIDGGSRDDTLSIAKQYSCRLINNSKVDQVYAKYMGYSEAEGKYLLFLDSDEVLENKKSIRNKVNIMISNDKVKIVLSSGYKTSDEYPPINVYLSELGDPFTYFMYRDSKDWRFFLINLLKKYKVISVDSKKAIFDFSKTSTPFIELTSMGVLIDLGYVRRNIPEIFKNPSTHTHLFYLMNLKNNLFVVMKNDAIVHYSASTLTSYLKKLRSRIKSNIFSTDMGKAGFSGRENYQSLLYTFKKFAFVLYVISVIFPLVDAIYLSLSRRKLVYLLHFILSFIVLFMVIYFYILKILGKKINLVGYGT